MRKDTEITRLKDEIGRCKQALIDNIDINKENNKLKYELRQL